MTKLSDILAATGEFAWDFGKHWFIEIKGMGNFVWSDPDYGGDNSIRPFPADYAKFCEWTRVQFCRSKGTKVVGHYIAVDPPPTLGEPITISKEASYEQSVQRLQRPA